MVAMKSMSWALVLVVLGNAMLQVQGQTNCADEGVTDDDSCAVFCGGEAGGMAPNAIFLDSGTCTCLGCLFCTTCTGGPSSGPVAEAPEGAPGVAAYSVGPEVDVNTSNASIIVAEHAVVVMFPIIGLLVSLAVYRKHRQSHKQADSIPLVAEDMPSKGYGALATEITV